MCISSKIVEESGVKQWSVILREEHLQYQTQKVMCFIYFYDILKSVRIRVLKKNKGCKENGYRSSIFKKLTWLGFADHLTIVRIIYCYTLNFIKLEDKSIDVPNLFMNWYLEKNTPLSFSLHQISQRVIESKEFTFWLRFEYLASAYGFWLNCAPIILPTLQREINY